MEEKIILTAILIICIILIYMGYIVHPAIGILLLILNIGFFVTYLGVMGVFK